MTIIRVTEEAARHISEICDGAEKLLRVRVTNKGCSGHKYEYEIISQDEVNRLDEVVRWDGGGLVVHASSVMQLIGSTLTLKGTLLEKYLSWENPLAANLCGCGESFSLKG